MNKGILLRLDEDTHRRLKQAALDEDTTVTEILRQGALIRLSLSGKEGLPGFLEQLGYEPPRDSSGV
jgi:hypothetical protein